MNPAALLSDLRSRGVELTADGDHLRYRAPRGVLSSGRLLELKSQKVEILALLGGEQQPEIQAPHADTPPAEFTHYQRAESDWQAAIARALAGFDRHAVKPSAECLEGAAMLELWIADGRPPRPGASLDDLRGWVESVYAGRSVARLTDTGRVVLRSVPKNEGCNDES